MNGEVTKKTLGDVVALVDVVQRVKIVEEKEGSVAVEHFFGVVGSSSKVDEEGVGEEDVEDAVEYDGISSITTYDV